MPKAWERLRNGEGGLAEGAWSVADLKVWWGHHGENWALPVMTVF